MTSNLPGQSPALCGQLNQVAACGSHSAGSEKPSSAGVAAWFNFGGDIENVASIAATKPKGKRFFQSGTAGKLTGGGNWLAIANGHPRPVLSATGTKHEKN